MEGIIIIMVGIALEVEHLILITGDLKSLNLIEEDIDLKFMEEDIVLKVIVPN